MTIYGPEPLDNQEAQVSFGAMVTLAEQRIDAWFTKFQDTPLNEPSIIGYVMALRGIAEANHDLARAGSLHFSKVERWKAAFENWIEKFGGEVKVKRGVDRNEMWKKALREFDVLRDVLRRP